MQHLVQEFSANQRKASLVDVRSGDIVRVHQRISEGGKARTQVFEGLVIRVDRRSSLTARITVRRMASGVGVEKSFMLHSPLVEKVEVIKRSQVRRNYLSYMRARSGKSARLAGVEFDRESVNASNIEQQRADIEVGVAPEPVEAKAETKPDEAEAKPEAQTEPAPAEVVALADETQAPQAEKTEDESEDHKVKAKKAKAEAFRQAHEK